jgi:hypothetical protein
MRDICPKGFLGALGAPSGTSLVLPWGSLGVFKMPLIERKGNPWASLGSLRAPLGAPLGISPKPSQITFVYTDLSRSQALPNHFQTSPDLLRTRPWGSLGRQWEDLGGLGGALGKPWGSFRGTLWGVGGVFGGLRGLGGALGSLGVPPSSFCLIRSTKACLQACQLIISAFSLPSARFKLRFPFPP